MNGLLFPFFLNHAFYAVSLYYWIFFLYLKLSVGFPAQLFVTLYGSGVF